MLPCFKAPGSFRRPVFVIMCKSVECVSCLALVAAHVVLGTQLVHCGTILGPTGIIDRITDLFFWGRILIPLVCIRGLRLSGQFVFVFVRAFEFVGVFWQIGNSDVWSELEELAHLGSF